MSYGTISPAQLVRAVLVAKLKAINAGDIAVVVGPADNPQQQAGVVSMVDAGMPSVENYTPIITTRVQMRCLAGRLLRADEVARTVQRVLTDCGRTLVEQDDGYKFLVHYVIVDAGPSMHYDSPNTNETLLFASTMIGSEPVYVPA